MKGCQKLESSLWRITNHVLMINSPELIQLSKHGFLKQFENLWATYWCVKQAGNGWVAGGCWGLLGLSWMIMKWIIPSFPIWSTRKANNLVSSMTCLVVSSAIRLAGTASADLEESPLPGRSDRWMSRLGWYLSIGNALEILDEDYHLNPCEFPSKFTMNQPG